MRSTRRWRRCAGAMRRVVLDTVVLVRALINPHGIWGRLLHERAGDYRLVSSPPLLTEYPEVTARPELTCKFRALPARLRDLLDQLTHAEIVLPAHSHRSSATRRTRWCWRLPSPAA